MAEHFNFIIVGAGLAGVSAMDAILEQAPQASITVIGNEREPAYHRPPLSKQLWTGKKRRQDVFVHPAAYYTDNGVTLRLETEATQLDVRAKRLRDSHGTEYAFDKLLLATGGAPRRLTIPGGDLPGVIYYRSIDDYDRTSARITTGKSVVVIGGGFIGSELAAAFSQNGAHVTMIFPDRYLCARVFPDTLGETVQRSYEERGVKIVHSDAPASITEADNGLKVHTENGKTFAADLVVAGIGITPLTKLAENAGLKTGDGIIVNELLQTSSPDIFAAGDNAWFPYLALGRNTRVEHWDNAQAQGRTAGLNMTGGHQEYAYMPYFFSDLFNFGYEAVGDVSTRLQSFADWQTEGETGVIYYLEEKRVRGVMLCNVWGKVDAARKLIREDKPVSPAELKGKIAFD